jgi:hypothetical protein
MQAWWRRPLPDSGEQPARAYAKTLPDGRTYMVPAPPLSATEIIRSALRLAAGAIEDENKGP